MATARKPYYTPDEYLKLERRADVRSEYIAGEIFAMAGASRRHNVITLNVASELRARLTGACETYVNDMRVRVRETGMFTYPDVVVACGEQRFSDQNEDTLLNPTLIVEVLSPSTESYDRGEKFAHYRRCASLREYILVAQDTPRVERFERHGDAGDEWLYTVGEGIDAVVTLSSVPCTLPLADIYRRIAFPDRAADAAAVDA